MTSSTAGSDENDGSDEIDATGEAQPALGLIDVALREMPTLLAGVDVEAMELVLLLHRVTNTLVYDLESTVHRPAGWSWAAFRSLFTLWVGGPLESKRLAELSGMSRQAVSALTKTLEADGLVDRSAATGDGRSVVLALSAGGRRRLAAAFAEHNGREARWMGALERTERVELARLLGKLADASREPWVSHRF